MTNNRNILNIFNDVLIFFKKNILTFFKSYSNIFFINSSLIGILIFLITFIYPSVGILGAVSILTVILFAEFLGLRNEYLTYGYYIYNSLLVGMGIGYYFNISIPVIILTMAFSVFTFMITFGLKRIFRNYYLPILSFPFAFVSMIFYLATLKYHKIIGDLAHHKFFDINFKFAEFFKSIGHIIFLNNTIAGIILFLIIFYYSRVLAFLATIGFFVGVIFHSFFVGLEQSLLSHYNFNFILIAMALGGVFLIPNVKSYLIGLIGVILSVVLIDALEVFFNLYSLPVYTLPFNLIVILFLLLLYSINYKYINTYLSVSPEKSLQYYLSNIFRFGGNDIKIGLPFTGKWTVYQAFDDEWTHKGDYKYAYDFVIKKEGKTYQNDGLYLNDYYAFGQPVISPISGYVVEVKNDLPDNFIGTVDRINNWGNYVIIRDISGLFYVEISHFMQYSITVKPGDYVEKGQIIGKCGNSGYSPEPHIHIQVQYLPTIGSYTVPFKFTNYLKDDLLVFYGNPKKDEEIEGIAIDKNQKFKFTFILDEVFEYEVFEKGIFKENIKFLVKMNKIGEFYLTDGSNRLYFHYNNDFFYFYKYEGKDSYLKEIFKIVPRIPFINKYLKFYDYLPIYLKYKNNEKIKNLIYEFLLTFNYNLFNKKELYMKDYLKIESRFGKAEISFYDKGFKYFYLKDKNIELKIRTKK